MATRKFFLDQHGCAKNQVDGELIISRLLDLGYEHTYEPEQADLIIINSCGFIQSAKEESINSFMEAKSAYPKAKVVLAGCLAERYAEVFKGDLPEADGIVGNGDLSLIDETVARIFDDGSRPVLKAEQKGVCCGERKTMLSYKGSAFVKVTEGCDNRCSFCAIPLIRGSLRSRKIAEIVEEIKSLLANGIFEINLIGQDLAAYGCGLEDDFEPGKNWHDIIYRQQKSPLIDCPDFTAANGHSPLYQLIKAISALEGNFWVRLLYIHPDHFNTDILEVLKEDNRFLPYFDIPFQSGDSTIIRAMNRKGSSQSYINLVRTIRRELPDSCIRTTFLTGFPGESKENAAATEEFLKEIRSDWSGCFAYSREDDTPAFSMKKQVSTKIAQSRADVLASIQHEITIESLRARVGKEYDVLIEEIVENPKDDENSRDEGLAIGRAWFDAPEVDGSVVVRYDLDDAERAAKVVPGAVVRVKAVASSEVDIDSILL